MKTLFQNGLILDGTGSAPRRGSVLIDGDRILNVGGEIEDEFGTAKREGCGWRDDRP